MATTQIAPPNGFIIDPPEGFQLDTATAPEGFALDVGGLSLPLTQPNPPTNAMELAAQNFQAASQAGMLNPQKTNEPTLEPRTALEQTLVRVRNLPIAKFLLGDTMDDDKRGFIPIVVAAPSQGTGVIGKTLSAGVSDIAARATKTEDTFGGNIKAFWNRDQLPIHEALQLARNEEKEQGITGWRTVAADISLGLTEMVPKVALMRYAPGGLAKQSAASVGIFGFDDKGDFQPRQAAFAALFPAVIQSTGAVTDAAINRAVQSGIEWVGNPTAQKAIHVAANQAAMNGLILAQESPHLAELKKSDPEEYQRQLFTIIGSNLAFAIPEALRTYAPKEGDVTTKPRPTLPEGADKATPLVGEQPSPVAIPKPAASDRQPTQTLGITPKNPLLNQLVETIGSKEWWKTHFTAEGALPKPVYDEWVKSRGQIASQTRQITYSTRDLYKALRELYSISPTRQFTAGMRDVPQSMVHKLNAALTGEIPITDLPPQLQAPVQKMRGDIDAMSQQLLDKGLIDGDLAATVGNNLGVYLTRSYRIFDDPTWVKNIPPDIRQNAETYVLNEMRAKNPAATTADAQTKLRELLADWSDSGLDKQLRAGKLGSKDLSLFMKRQDIAPEIRAVLGEYKDPVVNYARSMTKIARFIGDQEFLNFVRRDGIGKYLFEDGRSIPGFESQLASKSSDTMSPLNGLRTSPAIRAAFERFAGEPRSNNFFARLYFGLNAVSKGAKTVGSLLTQAHNLIGQPFFNLMGGDWNMLEYGKSIRAIAADVGASDSRTFRDYYRKLKELGITHESARAEELRAVMRDAALKDLDVVGLSGETMARALRKAAIDAPIRLYQVSDELGKIVGFENKKALLKKAHPTWTEQQVETAAAERVRNSYPTYSKVPNTVRQLRKQPLFGPFISFAYESMRTSYHNARYALQDLQSGNPVLQRHAIAHAAGMLTAAASGYVLAQLSKAMLGISGNKEDDIRRFLPRWDKNAQLIFTGTDGKGGVSFINWSYQNPYSYMTDPLIALSSGQDKTLLEKSIQSLGEFVRPYANEQMLAAAIMDVSRNTTSSGRQVYNPQDTPDDKWQKSAAHLLGAIEPGTTYRLRTKIIPAATQDQPDYGRRLRLKSELGAELTGFRMQNLDFNQALSFKARKFSENLSDAEYLFRGLVGKTGSVSSDALVKAYKNSDEQRFKLWAELYQDAEAAQRNGVTRGQVVRVLKDNGIADSHIGFLLAGRYMPIRISEGIRESAARHNRQLPIAELVPYIQSRSGIPLVPVGNNESTNINPPD